MCSHCGSAVMGGRYCSECGHRLVPASEGADAEGGVVVELPFLAASAAGRGPPPEPPPLPRHAPEATPGDLRALIEPRGGSSEPPASRHGLALELLALARSDRSLERARGAREIAAAFLRRYEARRATQEAYAGDLADWLVWLARARIEPFDAT